MDKVPPAIRVEVVALQVEVDELVRQLLSPLRDDPPGAGKLLETAEALGAKLEQVEAMFAKTRGPGQRLWQQALPWWRQFRQRPFGLLGEAAVKLGHDDRGPVFVAPTPFDEAGTPDNAEQDQGPPQPSPRKVNRRRCSGTNQFKMLFYILAVLAYVYAVYHAVALDVRVGWWSLTTENSARDFTQKWTI